MQGFRIFRTSTKTISSLPSYNSDRPKSGDPEPEVKKDEVAMAESSVGDIFQDIFGEAGEEVPENKVPTSDSKRHVRRDDEPDDDITEEEPAKPRYSGTPVDEGVQITKAAEVESADLDDLISQVMNDQPIDQPRQDSPKRPTSTPSKDDAKDADFGEGLSLIRGDDEPVSDDKPKSEAIGNKREDTGSSTRIPLSSGTRTKKPGSSSLTTTITTSYSSRFVPAIPASFYKDIQARLEDLIFKFECLDNEYAALQKISHNINLETSEIIKKLSM